MTKRIIIGKTPTHRLSLPIKFSYDGTFGINCPVMTSGLTTGFDDNIMVKWSGKLKDSSSQS